MPEESTTKLERAQWDYDRAVLARDQAAAAVRDKDQAIIAARERLDQAKREAAAAIPVDRSARDKESFKFGVVMDDKVVTVDMPWATLRETSEVGLAEYILKQMRCARDAIAKARGQT